MTIMVGIMAAGRHTWHWSSSPELTSDPQTGLREEGREGEREKWGERKNARESFLGF